MNSKFYKMRRNRMISGVLAGLSDKWNFDVTLVRFLFAIFTVANFGLIESQTIRENLELGMIGKKKNKKQEKEKLLLQALQAVRLDYLSLNQKIYELSGGEAQRVALAKIILKNPPLILADEPTASLDPKNSKEIMEILLELRNTNRTIIIATHNPSIWKMADQVIRLSKDETDYN